ncbi:MAG: TIGR04282 family arsenosugar biosynthesis glycosyltransferase [Candidatus Didemnitutus sp.]|nr:TIGR04282 family arsenosugar biosynthesis glycosyltransferase [Candidatus Didemnitutus sp.]
MSSVPSNVGPAMQRERRHRLPTVVVMLKAPREGTVKTRLAADVGPAQATRIYRLLVERQLAAIPAHWPVEVHFAPADAHEEMRDWLGPRPRLCPQADGDLGQRLTRAVNASFAHGAAAVLVIGGDCPELDRDALQSAAGALGTHEVVLGPASDGGYYLIGLTLPQPEIFADIPWSTSGVLTATLQKTDAVGLIPLCLSVRDDVDTLADLQKHAALLFGVEAPPTDFCAPLAP